MNSIAYIACLLVAYSAASPAQPHSRRCYGSYGCSNYGGGLSNGFYDADRFYGGQYGGGYGTIAGPGWNGFSSSHQEQHQQQQSSSSRSNSYNNGLGAYGASSQFNQQSSSSSSSSKMTSSFSSLGSQISQLQYRLASRSINQESVIQQMSQLASSFQGALSLGPSCGNCFNQGDFPSSLTRVFQQFTTLLKTVQSSFGASYKQICSPFSGLESSFKYFFSSASSSGLSINTIVPQALSDLLKPVLPGFGQNIYGL